jgi:hypothetical protein
MPPHRRTPKPERTPRARGTRARGGDTVHAGRVTKHKPSAPPSGRYTPPTRTRSCVRPGWHKVAGVTVIVAGAALFFTCQFNGWGIHRYGGHVWYLVGLVTAATSMWWFGAFDRTPPPLVRRG